MNLGDSRLNDPENGPGPSQLSQYRFGWIAGGVIIMLYLIGSGALMLLVSGDNAMEATSGNLPPRLFLLWAATSQILFFLVPTLISVRWSPAGIAGTLRLRRPRNLDLVLASLGMISCAILSAFYVAVQEVYLVPAPLRDTYVELQKSAIQIDNQLFFDGNIGLVALGLFAIALLPAIGEEFFFRGVLQRSFEARLRPFAAILLTATLFASIHFQPTHIVPLVGIGLFLGYLAWKTRSIWTAVAGHFFFNGLQIVALNTAANSPLAEPGGAVPGDVVQLLPAAAGALVVLILSIRTLQNRHKSDVPA